VSEGSDTEQRRWPSPTAPDSATSGQGPLVERAAVPAAPQDALGEASGSYSPVLSRDELTIYFAAPRPIEIGCDFLSDQEIRVATRPSIAAEFAPSLPVPLLSSQRYSDSPSWLSPDGCRLYFSRSDIDGAARLFVAEKSKPDCAAP
jgi:hypothetical protein